MLALAVGEHPTDQSAGRAGVRSHQLLLSILGAAQGETPRRSVAAELAQALRHTGPYYGSVEELTPIRRDSRTAIPVALAAATTIIWPPAWRWFVSGSVEAYALTPAGWDEILANLPSPRPA
jgi:hypothetical protein